MAARTTKGKKDKAEEPVIHANVKEQEDGTAIVTVSVGDSEPVSVHMKDTSWGLIEDVLDIEEARDKGDAHATRMLVDFWKTYIVGGVRAVPLRLTEEFFQAISAYVNESAGRGDRSKN